MNQRSSRYLIEALRLRSFCFRQTQFFPNGGNGIPHLIDGFDNHALGLAKMFRPKSKLFRTVDSDMRTVGPMRLGGGHWSVTVSLVCGSWSARAHRDNFVERGWISV